MERIAGADNYSPVQITNEPRRIACSAPDLIVTKSGVPVGHIETKKIGTNLNGKKDRDQFERYRRSLSNLIITDYLKFKWYVNGELKLETIIGKETDDGIKAKQENVALFEEIINDFARSHCVGINTSAQLSKIMAAKARLMAGIIENILESVETTAGRSSVSALHGQLKGFREVLIPNITNREFSDIYAQTIAYGMFAANLNCPESENFNRGNAASLIPHSNPFLRQLFNYVAGFELDDRLCWIVDELADMFN